MLLRTNQWNLTEFCLCIGIGKRLGWCCYASTGELGPLIIFRILFLLDIVRINGWNASVISRRRFLSYNGGISVLFFFFFHFFF